MKSVQDTSFIISMQFLTKHRQEVHKENRENSNADSQAYIHKKG